jgi:hypothetical protein
VEVGDLVEPLLDRATEAADLRRHSLLGAVMLELEENVATLDNLHFAVEELERIDAYAVEGGVDLWRGPATS